MLDGDQFPRLDAPDWPDNARFSLYKVGILEKAGVLNRKGAGLWFRVQNGSAVYRVILEDEFEIALELVQGIVI